MASKKATKKATTIKFGWNEWAEPENLDGTKVLGVENYDTYMQQNGLKKAVYEKVHALDKEYDVQVPLYVSKYLTKEDKKLEVLAHGRSIEVHQTVKKDSVKYNVKVIRSGIPKETLEKAQNIGWGNFEERLKENK